MELKPAKRKKLTAPNNLTLFPGGQSEPLVAYFDGYSVFIRDSKQMACLDQVGFFGRGTFSKNAPTFNRKTDDFPEVLLEQQWLNRKSLGNRVDTVCVADRPQNELAINSINSFLNKSIKDKEEGSWSQWKEVNECSKSIVERSGSNLKFLRESPSSFTNSDDNLASLVNGILESGQCRTSPAVQPREVLVVGEAMSPRLEPPAPAPKEVLRLTLYEAFFLAAALGKLTVIEHSGIMTVNDLWKSFQLIDEHFLTRYVAYHWYRSRGWVVRSGLKYGGDFVLYEKGPPYTHSSYVVRVCGNSLVSSWDDLLLVQRLVETFNKDIIFCHVIHPSNVLPEQLMDPEIITKFSVSESMCRRWIPEQQRDLK